MGWAKPPVQYVDGAYVSAQKLAEAQAEGRELILRRARYRGLPKVKLQNYFIGAACNVKRWLRREAWLLQQAAAAAG